MDCIASMQQKYGMTFTEAAELSFARTIADIMAEDEKTKLQKTLDGRKQQAELKQWGIKK